MQRKSMTVEDVRALSVESLPDEQRLRVVTAAELLTMEFPLREMVLDPIIPSQGLVMVHSKRGVGKTYLGLGIAYAVATGTEFLHWRAPRPIKVLYVDGEMPAISMQERLLAIVGGVDGSGPPNDDYFRIINPDLQDLTIPTLASMD